MIWNVLWKITSWKLRKEFQLEMDKNYWDFSAANLLCSESKWETITLGLGRSLWYSRGLIISCHVYWPWPTEKGDTLKTAINCPIRPDNTAFPRHLGQPGVTQLTNKVSYLTCLALYNLNFYTLEVVSRCREPQPQMYKKYLYIL